jgi:hypothetical protein
MNRTKDYLTNLPGHLAQPTVPATRAGHLARAGHPAGPGRAGPAQLPSLAKQPGHEPGQPARPARPPAAPPGPADWPCHSARAGHPSGPAWLSLATRPPGPATWPWPATWPGPGYPARLPSPAGPVGYILASPPSDRPHTNAYHFSLPL